MKKILISSILIILLINSISTCFAFDIGQKEIYSKGACPKLLTYKGIPIRTTYVVYNHNGIENPAYCLDVELPGTEGGSYIVSGSEKLENIEVWRAIINGFPYKSVQELGAANEQEAFVATKQAVYTMLHGRNIEDYGPVDSDEGRRTYEIYKNIVNTARSSIENLESNLNVSIIPVEETWKQDELDTKFLSKKYKVISNIKNGNVEIFLEGNLPTDVKIADLNNNNKNNFLIEEEFKILIPITSLIESSTIDVCAKVNLETKPVVYAKSTIEGKQDYALTGFWHEEIYTKISEKVDKNITKLRIIKKEYGTEKRLADVKFDILDENKNLLYKDLITNENGEIILENMIPGKYYIQETETLEDYNLYTDLIEVMLNFNEDFIINVNNTKREVEVFEKNIEEIEVTASKTETKYIENKVIHEIEDITQINSTNINTLKNSTVKRLPKTGY